MALTPEDVVNKRFQSTKFREGYDQDEVDDFLDEIVVELRRLTQENDELRQRLVAADARIAELQRGAGAPAGMQAPAAAPMVPAPAPAFEAPAPAPAPVPAAAPAADASADTNNLLQLARRLHEEHVRDGLTKKEQLIAEGEAEAARIISEAASAQQGQLQALQEERATLQRSVDELRTFEREYRQQLRTYI
ncbi:MAG: DivIVA domain-containing protein, partial [Microcella sp.]|nr:DivIVA domain-containing protein [Microcella sp.]